MVNIRMVQVHHNFRNQKGMHHHLIVHLRPKTEVSMVARIRSISRRGQLCFKLVCHNKEVRLLHVLSMVEISQEIFVMARQVASSVFNRVYS